MVSWNCTFGAVGRGIAKSFQWTGTIQERAIKLLEDYISLHKRRVGLSIEILKIIGISWLAFSGSSMELGLGKLKKQKDGGLSDNRMTIPN